MIFTTLLMFTFIEISLRTIERIPQPINSNVKIFMFIQFFRLKSQNHE